MKTIFALCAVILIGGALFIYHAMRMPNKYGDFTGAPKAKVADLIARPKEYLRKTVAVDDVVREQCTTMGCYFFFHTGDRTLRVDIAVIAMNAPRKNGHRARVEGVLVPFDGGYQFAATAVEFQ